MALLPLRCFQAALLAHLAVSVVIRAEQDSKYFALNYTPNAACDLPIPPSMPKDPTMKQYGKGTFTQPLLHKAPELGNFTVNYYWNSTFWAGSGSPIVVFLPGEVKADRHLVFSRPDFSLVGVIAENLRAAVIVPEHRYYGGSSPFAELTTSNLSYLTVEDALLDIVNLANHFNPPWTDAPSTAQDVPWILTGGSYSGAQTAWVANVFGGVFWAYVACSPIVQSITSYWQYYLPQIEHGRQVCTSLMDRILSYIDSVFQTNGTQVQTIKDLFGLPTMDDESFLYEITTPVTFWSEQELGRPARQYNWLCDLIEGIESDYHLLPAGVMALLTSEGVERRGEWNSPHIQMLRALHGYAEGFRQEISPALCFKDGFCTSKLDPENFMYSDLRVDNDDNRQYAWLQCNDLISGYIVGAPQNETSLVSRLTTAEFFLEQCALFFPNGPNGETFGAKKGRTAHMLNEYTGGWSPKNATRIIYSSGSGDVWREMGVAAQRRPGGPMQSIPEQDIVVHVIETGFHHSELMTRTAEKYPEVRKVRDLEVEQICSWVQQWPGYR